MAASSFFTGILKSIQQGDFAILAILVSWVIAIAVSIERSIRLFFQYPIHGPAFMIEIQKHLLANDLEGALRLCHGTRQAVLPQIIRAGLQRASYPEHQIQNAIDATSLEMIPQLEKRLPYLALIANITTLFGLLGTISGLIHSFSAIALANPSQRQVLLSQGISEAMNATAFGLMAAIFTMIAHSLLSHQANQILEDIDQFSVKLLDLLAARNPPVQSKNP